MPTRYMIPLEESLLLFKWVLTGCFHWRFKVLRLAWWMKWKIPHGCGISSHLNFCGLKTLQQKNMVIGLLPIVNPSQVCEQCVAGKKHRSQFPQGKSWRATKALELVHYDICGPIKPTSNGGKNYFIIFIDDYTRKTWIISCRKNHKLWVFLKASKCMLKIIQEEPLKLCGLIMKVNIVQHNKILWQSWY